MGYDINSNSVKFGDLCQEIVIKFLEECGWKWVAGERNSFVSNVKDLIFGKISGTITERGVPKLIFFDEDGIKNYILMPDELFIKNNSREFVEVKGRNFDDSIDKFFWERKRKVDSYSRTKENLNIPVWLVVCIKKNNGYRLYMSDVDKAISNSETVIKFERVYDQYGDICQGNAFYAYEWKTPKGFQLLNKTPLSENYLNE